MAKVKVRYVGPSDERHITPEDVKPRGIEIPKTLVWERWNGFQVVIEDASDDFVKLLREQDHFTVTAVKDDGAEGETIAVAENPNKVETVVASEEGKSTQKSTVNK